MIHEIVKQADAPFKIKEMVPAGSWLEKYYDFLTASTDAPDQYVLASGLSIMGMMFRSVSLEFGVITIRPNIWLTIVGRSTMFRKSTVLNATKSVLRDLDCLQLPEQTTPEAFLGMLADNDYGHAEGFFNWYEMGAVLKNYQKSHMRAMLEILTELYDCPDRYTRLTKTEGIEEVDNPFISILGATTQRWLNDSISSGDVEGGFLPRFLWVQASRKTRHHPIPKAWNQNEKIRVQDELREMADNYQGCQFYLEEDSPAYHLYSDYHLRTEKEIARHPESDTIGSFYARILTYAIKFSMIFHIMLHPKQLKPELALSAESMKLAIIWADFFKANVDLVTDSMAFDPKGADRKRIVQIIAANPAISRKMLLKKSKLAVKELDEALETLIEAQWVGCRYEVGYRNRKKQILLPDERRNYRDLIPSLSQRVVFFCKHHPDFLVLSVPLLSFISSLLTNPVIVGNPRLAKTRGFLLSGKPLISSPYIYIYIYIYIRYKRFYNFSAPPLPAPLQNYSCFCLGEKPKKGN
jgi:hypothetical protein